MLPSGFPGSNPGVGAFFPTELKLDSNQISSFVEYVTKKKYSNSHTKKLVRNAKKWSNYTHFFSYDKLRKLDFIYSLDDGMYKTIRALCHYFEESNHFDTAVVEDIEKIRKILKAPRKRADIYVPTEIEVQETLEILKDKYPSVYNYYLCLLYSGARVNEVDYWWKNKDKLRIIQKDGYFKVEMNYQRGSRNSIYLYLPNSCKDLTLTTYNFVTRIVQSDRRIIRPKYLCKFFYTKCLNLDIPSL